MTKNDLLRKILKISWATVAFWLIVWIVLKNFPFDGRLVAQYIPGQPSPFVGGFQPDTRVKFASPDGMPTWSLFGDPVYFPLTFPPFFSRAEVGVTFKNEGAPLVEFGPRTSLDRWQFDLKPLDFPALDSLAWPKRSDGNLTLYERKPTGRSAAEILNDASADSGDVAVYHLDPARWNYALSDRRAAGKASVVRPLLGSHRFYTYVAKPPFGLAVELQDLNRHSEAHPVEVRVVRGDATVLSKRLEDDGAPQGKPGPSRTLEISIPDAAAGLYRVEIDAGDEIVIRRIDSKQAKMTFIGRVRTFDEGEKTPLDLFVYGGSMSVSTDRAEGFQDVTLDGEAHEISAAGSPVRLVFSETGPHRFKAPQGNLDLEGKGLFAFGEAAFFDPEFVTLDWDTDLKGSGFGTIVADYRPPETSPDGWETARAEFAVDRAALDRGKVQMAFSLPGAAAAGGKVDVRDIEVEFVRGSLTPADVLAGIGRRLARLFR